MQVILAARMAGKRMFSKPGGGRVADSGEMHEKTPLAYGDGRDGRNSGYNPEQDVGESWGRKWEYLFYSI